MMELATGTRSYAGQKYDGHEDSDAEIDSEHLVEEFDPTEDVKLRVLIANMDAHGERGSCWSCYRPPT